jgi:type I restriction enzyme, S subunit
LSSKNVYNDGIRINENESQISNEDHLGIVRNGYPAKGDLLITIVGTIGRSCVYELNRPLSFQRSVCFLRPNESTDPYFLHYCAISNFFLIQLENYINKSAQSGVYLGNLKEVIIPSIKKDEQNHIVKYLDYKTQLIDDLIEKTKKKIELLKERRTTLINHCVTKGLNPGVEMKDSGIDWIGNIPKHWKIVKLKYLTKKVGSGLTPRGGSNIYGHNGIPFLRSQNIHFDGLKLDDIVFIPLKTHQLMSNSKVLPNDVLMNITGASIGRCFYIEPDSIEYNVNQHVCIIRPNKKIITKFLYYLLCSDLCQFQIPLNNTGSGKEGLNFQNIKNFILFKVDKREQYQIVDYLDSQSKKIDKIIEKENKRIELLKEYRKSLISEVVTGKIDVRDEVVA